MSERRGLVGILDRLRGREDAAYRRPEKALSCISGRGRQEVELRATDALDRAPEGEMYRTWRAIAGAHKWHHYFATYERVRAGFEGRPIRMLEIGVYKGASIRMWREVLHPEAIVVGVDIDEQCAQFEDAAQRLHIRIGDQSDATFLRAVVEEFGPFDFILDDGSHVCSHMIASFGVLFMEGLVDHGVYLLEDTHTNFWPSHRDQAYSFVDFAKDLVDVMHWHYFDNTFETRFRLGGQRRVAQVTVPAIAAQIDSVEFGDSLIVVRKKPIETLPISEHL